MARTLRMGENTFRRPCDFKELRVVKRAHITTFALCGLMAAFVPHRPNKYFHVTASNGIVSSSPDTPLAIMTASPIASVRVFETSAMQMSSRYGRCAPNAVDDRSRDHHAERSSTSGPSSSGKTLPSFHPLLARPCNSPQRLPRERFSPLAQS